VTTALYRRYRPETFEQVIGQEHVTAPLMQALSKGRVTHAYLFSGPRGCGKTTSARILARCLNCAQGPTPTPCGECDSCHDLANGGPGSIDVVEIDAASHNGVDDARDLRERVSFAPARDRFKVYILDEAHMVTAAGFNALLKTVEEPPPHVKFIFATTEPDKVLTTIRSRTHHYPFRLVPPGRLTTYLGELSEREGVPIGKGVLPLVVRAGGGSVRDTLSVLDQLIAGAGDDGVTYDIAVALLGYTHASLLDDVVEAIAAGDGATVFRAVEKVVDTGQEPRRFADDLLQRLRDLVIVAAVGDAAADALAVPEDALERLKAQASHLGRTELSRAADVVAAGLEQMTGATSPRLQLELLCARLLLPGADADGGIGSRMDRMERRLNAGPLQAAPAPQATPAPRSEPRTEPRSEPAEPVRVEPAAALPETRATDHPAADHPAADHPVAEQRPADAWPAARTPGEAPARAESPTPETAPARTPAPAPAGGAEVETIRRLWTDVLDKLKSMKRVTWALVSDSARVEDHRGGVLTLQFKTPGLAQTFSGGNHAGFVAEALIQVTGIEARVQAAGVTGGDSGGGRGQARQTRGGWSNPARQQAPAEPTQPARQPAPVQPAPRPEPQPGPTARATTPDPVSPPPGTGAPQDVGGGNAYYDDVPPPEEPIEDPGEDQLSRPSRRAMVAAAAVAPPEPPPVAAPVEEDTPSRDDEDADEESQLVGTAVVEQILGGKIISTDEK
jgi:DNA polymerase-3 subunit gamma/tau